MHKAFPPHSVYNTLETLCLVRIPPALNKHTLHRHRYKGNTQICKQVIYRKIKVRRCKLRSKTPRQQSMLSDFHGGLNKVYRPLC